MSGRTLAVAAQQPFELPQVTNITDRLPQLFDVSHSIRIMEVAKKYLAEKGDEITHMPFYTHPGGPNTYHLAPIKTSWTQGFLPALLWLLIKLHVFSPASIHPSYQVDQIITLARRWQESFRWMARPSRNHDQGFRFQLSFSKDWELTGREEAKEVVLVAAESLMARYSPGLGVIRSWDGKYPGVTDDTGPDDHYMVIIDNMMNLDLLYQATALTFDPKYAKAATSQADITARTFIRDDCTTYHVVDFDPHSTVDESTGHATVLKRFTHQGYADESCWDAGSGLGDIWLCTVWSVALLMLTTIQGMSQRTADERYVEICRRLADVFLAKLHPSGVPKWDFDAPAPTAYDASAGTIAANGLRMLSVQLLASDPEAAEYYLERSIKLIQDILRECLAPPAYLNEAAASGPGHQQSSEKGEQETEVDWGRGGWESILMHSTITGNPKREVLMDHGMIYADYYLMEYAVEMLKLSQRGNDEQ